MIARLIGNRQHRSSPCQLATSKARSRHAIDHALATKLRSGQQTSSRQLRLRRLERKPAHEVARQCLGSEIRVDGHIEMIMGGIKRSTRYNAQALRLQRHLLKRKRPSVTEVDGSCKSNPSGNGRTQNGRDQFGRLLSPVDSPLYLQPSPALTPQSEIGSKCRQIGCSKLEPTIPCVERTITYQSQLQRRTSRESA
ncbi:hypothetical protein [Defluviicoccus vanus]|uniref:hypothetical protein n=1 Tax=Defluviicoccus vanus TaxID=111831 RepID=UPI001CBA6673|nr:hypothetical protein [Defluviicoccus vanus]